MKTKILLLSMLFVAFSATASDTDTKKEVQKSSDSGAKCYDENSHIVNLGVGLGGFRTYAYVGGTYTRTPTVCLTYEQPWKSKIGPGFLGVGAYAGYQHSYYRYDDYGSNYYYEHKWNNFLVAARATYHWDVLNFDKAEVYGGILIGVRFQTYNYETNYPANFYMDYELHNSLAYPCYGAFVGARWYFIKNIGLFAEAGAGNSYITGGVSFKF